LETPERAYEIKEFQEVVKASLVKMEMCQRRGEMR
jgi:hypothetical protein